MAHTALRMRVPKNQINGAHCFKNMGAKEQTRWRTLLERMRVPKNQLNGAHFLKIEGFKQEPTIWCILL